LAPFFRYANYDALSLFVKVSITSYYKASNIYTFSVEFRHSAYEASTTIRISLSERSDIESVFSIFDSIEEKYRIDASTNKNTANATKTLYSIERPLLSCNVDKRLLSDIENYLIRKAKFLEQLDSETTWKYRLTINDKYGTEDLPSIENFKFSHFPDDTRSITSVVGSLGNEISLRFNLDKDFSLLKIAVKSENSRQIVEGIAAEIFQLLNSYKTNNGFFHPPLVIGFLIDFAALAFFFLAIIFSLSKSLEASTAFSLAGFILLGYILFKKMKPYTTFDTRQNQNRERWNSWLIFASAEFILFTFLGGLILKILFGF